VREEAMGAIALGCRPQYAVSCQTDALTPPGGAISKETQLFLSTVLAPMMQGAWRQSWAECTRIWRPYSHVCS
jgi:hypothetical protein